MNNISPFIGIRPSINQSSKCSAYNTKTSLYDRSKHAIDELLTGELVVDQKPYYYLYKIVGSDLNIISLIATMPLKCYKNGLVIPHEMTFKNKESEYMNSLSKFKIQISPVLLIHKHDEVINSLLESLTMYKEPCNHYLDEKTNLEHFTWKIDENDKINEITQQYQRVEQFLLADGHHRISAASNLWDDNKKIMSMLTSCQSLNLSNIARGIRHTPYAGDSQFFGELNKYFHLIKLPSLENINALESHGGLIYINKEWYLFMLKEEFLTHVTNWKSILHSVFHMYLYDKILNIDIFSAFESNIISIPYKSYKDLERFVDSGELKLVICTSSLLIDELLTLSSHTQLFPPQSTYFEPKPIDGLIMSAL